MTDSYDVVFVGSGINSLAGAALLAKGGKRCLVLERNDWLGGAIKTAELTRPGFVHEVFASWHPLFAGSAAYEQLKDDLTTNGLEYLNTELPTGTLLPDGSSIFLTTSHERNVEELERAAPGDGEAWDRTVSEFMPNADLAFGVLTTELWSRAGFQLGVKAYRRLGRRGLAEFTGRMLESCRDWVTSTFGSEQAYGLLAPWVLHTGLGPDAAASGFMARVIAVAVELGGMPVPRGGGVQLVEALSAIIREAGGDLETSRDVEQVLVREGKATSVRMAGGDTVDATEAVVANVTPTQLYDRLLSEAGLLKPADAEARRFRYGRAEMQIHFALGEPPRWQGDERLGRTAIVHVTPGLDGVSRAVNEAERGLLPAEATIVCGQPLAVDPSRAPEGTSILWIQLQELPTRVKGDAAGELDVGDGTWTEELRERYADRIQARLATYIRNLDSSVLQRVALSPADIEAANVNMVGGDIYSGSCALDQSFVWRPRPGLPGHRTPIRGLYHIGASTHPGPGLGAGSGTLVAQQLLSRTASLTLDHAWFKVSGALRRARPSPGGTQP
ncbi:MAG: FAD-dependent oxidoreductase [Candidatus Rokuibacteriota bacterium]|nr:MAG: FAD-dependent oxidoreductase [Candidatus Rokubacteria bacterium]